VRTRIALSTAIAVLVIPSLLFMLFSSTPADGARTRHEAGTRHRAVKIDSKLTSYSKAQKAAEAQQAAQAQKAAQLASYYAAVAKAQEENYLKEYAYLQEVAANTMPAAWAATATCEEGGNDDPNYGYFGIKEWNGFDGYATAGSAPLSVQLAWEGAHGQGPPDAPGQCHSY
jgi:hypothetical protein